jgi:hypothetical protein
MMFVPFLLLPLLLGMFALCSLSIVDAVCSYGWQESFDVISRYVFYIQGVSRL